MWTHTHTWTTQEWRKEGRECGGESFYGACYKVNVYKCKMNRMKKEVHWIRNWVNYYLAFSKWKQHRGSGSAVGSEDQLPSGGAVVCFAAPLLSSSSSASLLCSLRTLIFPREQAAQDDMKSRHVNFATSYCKTWKERLDKKRWWNRRSVKLKPEAILIFLTDGCSFTTVGRLLLWSWLTGSLLSRASSSTRWVSSSHFTRHTQQIV